ncbi:MAG: AAA family ATPase [Mariprofundaceae bacterium]
MDKQKLPAHIQALFDPSAYPHQAREIKPEEIKLIQTHISWVFLTGEFAYKIKKPVNLGFLDFSSLSKRKQACKDELILNRRLAPEIYLDVLPIYIKRDHHKSGYQLGNDSTDPDHTIDYCLKMIQFDQNDLFDARLQQNRFDPLWMDQLALSISQFHLSAEQSPYIEKFGSPGFLQSHIQESLNVGEKHLTSGEMPETLANLKERSRECFNGSREKLKARQHNHHIRNCHGDLHLRNITLFNNIPTLFDCIEFSDEYRMIDTMNDAAFLMMDCDARNRSDLGYRFLSRYLEQTGDYDGLQLLPLYLSYRAGVRGKVSCLSVNATLQQNEISKLYDAAGDYFTLAADYLTPDQPRLIIIGGLSGSGKSHLALLGLKHDKAIIIRSDATRKRITKDHPGLSLYSDEMHRLTYQSMLNTASTAIKAGFSVILDATFLHPASRQSAIELADSLKVPLLFYWLDMDASILRERVKQRTVENSDISDADLKVLEDQLSNYQRPDEPCIQFIRDSNSWPDSSNIQKVQ